MLETLVQGNDWLTYIDTLEHDPKLDAVAPAPSLFPQQESYRDAWDKTDRPLSFSHSRRSPAAEGNDFHAPMATHTSDRARWLKENDVHTEFLDAGIGCCWYAFQGDDEPVCGETEAAAIDKLARQIG
jgi:hypothetical protein